MDNKSLNGNYNQKKITTHHRNPIVRNKSLGHFNKNINPNIDNNKKIYNQRYPHEKIKRKNNDYKRTLSSRNNFLEKKNKTKNFEPINLNKSSSALNYFNDKMNEEKRPSTRNNKLSTLQKRMRNASAKNNDTGKAKNYFYKLICNNCYNNKMATKNLKKQPPEQKEILNKTFNKINPYYFQDKMNDMYKDNINNKIKELENLQKQVLDSLVKHKIRNPTNVEKLQRQNEFSISPLNSYEGEDPRLIQTKKNYDKKEDFINKNKDLYQIDKPRKAINDYYNKCLYQVPVMEKEYQVDPEYKKEVNKELKKQIEENNNNKKKKKNDQINDEKQANKKMNDYIDYLKKKNKEDKEKNKQDLIKRNKLLNEYKKLKEEQDKNNDKKFEEEFRKKIKEEENMIKEKKRQKKIDDMNKLQEWFGDFEKNKNNKKKEREDEDNKWKNYAVEFNNKCKHGLDVYRCAICNKVFPKDQLIKYYYPSSTDVSASSSKRSSFEK